MDQAIPLAWYLKALSIGFGVLAVWPAMRARRIELGDDEHLEAERRRKYLLSYALTTVSMLLFCAIGLLQ